MFIAALKYYHQCSLYIPTNFHGFFFIERRSNSFLCQKGIMYIHAFSLEIDFEKEISSH